MSRSRGRHGPREPEISEAEAREYGIRDTGRIPGGLTHLANPPVKIYQPPVPPKLKEFRGQDAHGVPPQDVGEYNREMQRERSHPFDPRFADQPPGPSPVPVYIVEGAGGPRPLRRTSLRHLAVPASTSSPARVCGQDPTRVEIRLLNEDTATNIRLAAEIGALALDAQNGVIVGGALLPWPANTYLSFPGQDDLWAIGATGSGTPLMSVIEVFEEQAS